MGPDGIVFNNAWGVDIALEMTFLSVASFAAVWAAYYWIRGERRNALLGSVVATVLPLGSLGILVSHLLKPASAYLVLPGVNESANLGSWMVWGGLGIGALVGASAVFVLLQWLNADARMGWLVRAVAIAAAAFGVFVAFYTGALLAAGRGIPFWQGAAVPVLGLLMGATAGTALYALFAPRVGGLLAIATGALVVVYGLHIALNAGGARAAAESAAAIVVSVPFLVGAVLAVAVVVAATVGRRRRWLLQSAGVAALAAVFLLRLALLEAGAWDFTLIAGR